jgi:hypothetical protein
MMQAAHSFSSYSILSIVLTLMFEINITEECNVYRLNKLRALDVIVKLNNDFQLMQLLLFKIQFLEKKPLFYAETFNTF